MLVQEAMIAAPIVVPPKTEQFRPTAMADGVGDGECRAAGVDGGKTAAGDSGDA